MGMALGITVTPGDDRRVLFTEMPIAQKTLKAMVTGRGPIQDYRIAFLHMFDIATNGSYHSRSFMAHDNGLAPGKGIMIGMAEARRLDRDQYFILKGFVNKDFPQYKTSFAVCYGCPTSFAHTFENKKFAIGGP
jgi:hypothetical protein